MRQPKELTFTLLLIAVLLLIPALAFAEQDLPDPDSSTLFTDFIEIERDEHLEIVADSIDLPDLPQTATKRMARVRVEETINKARSMARGQTLIIELFDDETLTAKIDRAERVKQVDSVRARIEDSFFGFMILSVYDDKALIVIELPDQNKQYKVVYNHLLESHYLYEYNLDEIDELMPAPPLIPPDTTETVNEDVQEEIRIPETERPSREAPQRSEEETAATSPADVMVMTEPTEPGLAEREIAADQSIAEIDVMIVYTPAAESWASTHATSIHHVMNQAMLRAQLSMDNTFLDQDHTLINMNLVHSDIIAYVESGDASRDLRRLTDGTHGFAKVHQWRNHYGADLVALFSLEHNLGGISWLLNNPAGRPDSGFSLTRVQQAHDTYTHIHEMGHNMGAHHHKAQNFQPGPGLFSYSAGWRWVMPDGTRLCDLMTYEPGFFFADGHDHTRVAIFSNPNVLYGGVSSGDSLDGDNARTVREVRHVIAGYRTAIEDTELVIQGLTVEPSPSQLGTELTATIVVKNEGSTDITQDFWLDLYEHRDTPPAPLEGGDVRDRVEGLPAGATIIFTYEFTPNLEGTFKFWAQVDSYMEVSDNPQVFGPVAYIVEEEALPVHSIDNIVFDPLSPATLEFGDWVYSSFDYTTTNPGNVRITGMPMTQGSYTPNHGYLYAEDLPPGTGSGSARFRINDEGQTEAQLVDQVHFVMICDDTDQLLYEVISDVGYTFEPVALMEYELIISVAGNGSTDPEEGTHTYAEGEEVTVTATPDEGYEFVNWTEEGSEVSIDTVYTFEVTRNRHLVANFRAVAGEQIEAVILEKEAGVSYVEVDLTSWAMAFFNGPGDPIYDYVGGGLIVGVRSGGKYIDLFSFSEKYFNNGGDFARALAEADRLAQEVLDKTELYKPSAEDLGAIFDPLVAGVWNIIIPFENAETVLGATKADKLELLHEGEVISEMEYLEREAEPQESFVAFAVQPYTLEEVRAFRVRIK